MSLHQREPSPSERSPGIAIATAGVLAIAILTLLPTSGSANIPFWCLTCGDLAAVDFLLNIPLFVPVGLGLGLARFSQRRTMLLAMVLTATVETLQFTVIAGRYASFRDLVTNTLGAWLGWQLARHWRSLVMPDARTARRLFASTATVWVLSQGGTSWMIASDPNPPPWWAQIVPHHFRFPAIFQGDVVALSVGSRAIIENDQLPDAARLRADLLRGATMRSVLTNVTPTDGLAPILALSAGENEAALLAQTGRDAVFRIRVRGVGAGFRPPSVRIQHAFAGARTDTFDIAGAYISGRFQLEAVRGGERLQRTLDASPSWGWAFLMPLSNYSFGPEVYALTALWLIGCLALVGFWAGRTRPAPARVGYVPIALASVIGVGLGVVPLAAGIPIAHWSEWLAALAGTTTGWIAGRRELFAALLSTRSVSPRG